MSTDLSFSWSSFQSLPIVGILRGLSAKNTLRIAEVFAKTGFSTLEVTMNTDSALAIITQLRREFPRLNIGAGTVCTVEELYSAKSAGATFMVTPIVDPQVITTGIQEQLPIFAGAYTPSEIYAAWRMGATAVKVFPATQLGPTYLKDILGPLNTIRLLPTGGISLDNIASYFQAGALGVGMGSSLIPKSLIAAQDYQGLEEHLLLVKQEIMDFIS